jgi:hypothetical protein
VVYTALRGLQVQDPESLKLLAAGITAALADELKTAIAKGRGEEARSIMSRALGQSLAAIALSPSP